MKSLLRDKIDSMAPSLGWKYRVVEKAGASIKSRVCRYNPWADIMCTDLNCLPCTMSEKQVDCKRRDLVYEVECITCKESPGFIYVGETVRSSREGCLNMWIIGHTRGRSPTC